MESTLPPLSAPLQLRTEATAPALARVVPGETVWWQRPPAIVFGVALLARLLVLVLFSSSPHFGVQSGDMRFYHEWALRILSGQWTDHRAFYGLPGYAFFLAGIYKVFGVTPAVALLLQSAVDALTAVLIFQLARPLVVSSRRWMPDAVAGLASLGWVLFVPAQALSVVLMPTVLATACYWFCVWQAAECKEVGVLWRWLGIGALVGLTATLVATVLFALPLLAVSLLLAKSSGLRRGVALALLFAGVAAGTSPAWLHNRFVAHEPVFLSAHSGINFWIGNAPGATGYPKIPAGLRAGQQELLVDSITVAERAVGRNLSRAEVSSYWSDKASVQIKSHPLEYLRLLGLKVRNFWNAYEYDDVTIVALLREEGALLPGIGFGLVATFGAAGLIWGLAGDRRACWVAAAVLLHMAALMPVFITERYRLAAVPGLLILGAYWVSRMTMAIEARRWAILGSGAVLVVGAAWLVHLPVAEGIGNTMEPYNLAISELDAGQLDRAERHLAMVQALAPGNASLLFAMGNLALKKGELEKAKGFYKQTLQKEPQNASAYTNLGVIAYSEKRWDWAAKFLKTALTIDPSDPGTRILLQRVEKELAPAGP